MGSRIARSLPCKNPAPPDTAGEVEDEELKHPDPRPGYAARQLSCTDVSLSMYPDTEVKDEGVRKILKEHQTSQISLGTAKSGCCGVPYQFCEHGLVRPNDGLPLETTLQSLADVDGDGVEVGEVVRAVFMVMPENQGDAHAGGELLYPEVQHGDEDQSAMEVELRAQMMQLEEKVAKMQHKVRQNKEELNDEGAKDTQHFIKEKASSLRKLVADLEKDVTYND